MPPSRRWKAWASVPALLPFEAAWPRRLRADLGGISVNVASLGDLIEMKRRVGCPQDLEDVRELEALAQDLGGRGDD